VCAWELVFRPFGAWSFPTLTHGLRHGLYSAAASRLRTPWSAPPRSEILSSHAVSKALTEKKGLIAALKALRHPRALSTKSASHPSKTAKGGAAGWSTAAELRSAGQPRAAVPTWPVEKVGSISRGRLSLHSLWWQERNRGTRERAPHSHGNCFPPIRRWLWRPEPSPPRRVSLARGPACAVRRAPGFRL